ncbi:MAG: hypothetical protein JO041_14375 [Acidobacteria bacterium]|nr:hypothetical protein [Acidobacteriota bacterium]
MLAVAVHGPLLLMQLPASSYDANTHMFFAAHYASHWFSPWNDKWFGGFSQTTYPPLAHQWVALFSHILGLTYAYMVVQLIVILLLTAGIYRYSRLWVDERAASYAAIAGVLLGSLAMLVYQSGQLPNTMATAMALNALPYFYEWSRRASGASLVKGVAITVAGAAAHHVTLLFGLGLFAWPVFVLALLDRRNDSDEASVAGVISRATVFAAIAAVLIAVVLLPYFIETFQHPITQQPIPHGSRDNYLKNTFSGLNFWVIPYGTLILALPFIFVRGTAVGRLRPLFFGWWLTTLIGLGGTTPVAPLLLSFRNAFNILTFERFTFWATIMALPLAGLLAGELIDRFHARAVVGLWAAAVFSCAMGVAWMTIHPINGAPFRVDQVISFLNRDDHSRFRYITLGFGNQFDRVSTFANAGSVDGTYNSARLLPELTAYGSAQLYNAKYYGTAGMDSLRAVLKHANQYGLKYIFVRDRFYEPLLAFAGWRQAESYDNGSVTLWTKEDVPPAHKLEFGAAPPPAWQGVMWGILPVGASIFAIFSVLGISDRRRAVEPIPFPAPAGEPAFREAK